jgi:hypothetical protein
VLFRISVQAALVVFAGVLVLALSRGMDPTLALVRGLVALIAITALGWLAEQIAGAARTPLPEPAGETGPDPAQDEPQTGTDE